LNSAQIWQRIRHETKLSGGRTITNAFFLDLMKQELEKIESQVGKGSFAAGKFRLAEGLFERMVISDEFPEFLTLAAYEELLSLEKNEGHPPTVA
jgi:malate synthase